MSTHKIEDLRNIGIIAHIDAGKTTTSERILFYSGASHRMGNVDDGNTTTDFDPEESQRGITIYSAAITCQWKHCRINIIDTPGHVDFTAEVERSLRVLDGAVVIFSAVEGVEAQSETVWRQADRYQVPRLCFINKLDRIGASFDRTIEQIEQRLDGKPVPMTLPIGEGQTSQEDGLKGIIDLLSMKALYFDSESRGENIQVEEIPDDLKDDAELWRGNLIEKAAETDEDLMMAYLEGEEIDQEMLLSAIRKATLDRAIQPTYCGASLSYIGVQPVLDGVVQFLPSPLDVPAITGESTNPKKPGQLTRNTDPKGPLSALVFKIVAEQHADLYFARIYSGTLNSGSRVLNPRTGKKELISQLWHIQADQREKLEADKVEAGDIVGIIGPKETATGDTLCDQKESILLETISFPETVISMAVEPETSADRKKLADVLVRLERQDPTFTAKISEDTGQTIISGMGELHLEVLRGRIQRDFNLNVKVHKPRVSYRETISSAVEAHAEFNRPTEKGNLFFGVRLKLEPFETDKGLAFARKYKHDALSAELTKHLDEAVHNCADAGGTLGFPLMNLKVTVTEVEARIGETNDVAIAAAVNRAFQEALEKADVILLEPLMDLEVVSPEEFLGNVQADLQTRHAMIVGQEQRGHLHVIEAEVPLANMFGYSTQVRSLSQGRASYSMEPLKYAPAPKAVRDKMMGLD